MTGLWTLFYKELLRFWKVSLQTILSPVVTTLLYLLIFSHVLEAHVQVYPGVGYTAFLIPGLVMMAMLQNAFANSSSSLIQSKMNGNIVFMLLPPLAYWEFFTAYVAAAVVRGLVVGLGVGAGRPVVYRRCRWPIRCGCWRSPWLGCAMLGAVGIITALWARELRPDGGGAELHHHAADFSVRRVLLDPFPAAFLAGAVALTTRFSI